MHLFYINFFEKTVSVSETGVSLAVQHMLSLLKLIAVA